tara:strand:- start:5947 stop:6162 length:216 start_codon:yes stop_codon:yes gene_type:complete
MKKQSQYDNIKAHLEDGKTLQPLQALSEYGCYRLSAVIHKLRRDGYPIETNMKTNRGKTYAEYVLTYDKTN